MTGLEPPEDLRNVLGSLVADKYVVEECIGIGGMAVVFRARHEALNRTIAVKILRPRFSGHAEASGRFEREARTACRLEHPNCVQVFDCGITPRGHRFMLMPLLVGAELSTMLGEPLPAPLAAARTLQILRGLEYVHRQGIVHRDIKPENVFVTRDHDDNEVLKLVDFGIAKLVGESQPSDGIHTQAGMVVGSPGYISPEQAMGLDVDARTDLYATGIVAYEMLAGRVPFAADNSKELLRKQVQDEPPPLPEGTPTALSDFVLALLAKHPQDRPESASEAIARLCAILDGPEASSPDTPPTAAPADKPTAAAVNSDAGTYMFVPNRRKG